MSTSFRIRAFHAKAPVALNLRVSLLILREPQPRPSRLPQVHVAAAMQAFNVVGTALKTVEPRRSTKLLFAPFSLTSYQQFFTNDTIFTM